MSSTPPGQNTEHPTWNSLSKDTRLLIIQTLIQDGCTLSRLATVSREWQQEFERHTFARITLTPSRLPEFDSMTRRNRGLIRYLWLCLELDDYERTQAGCAHPRGQVLRSSDWEERVLVEDTTHGHITTLLEDLFSVLSTWDPFNDLTLDISIYPLSDAKHWLRNLTFEPDTPFDVRRNGDLEPPASLQNVFDDPEPGSVAGTQEFSPPRNALEKVLYSNMTDAPLETDLLQQQWWEQLPLVPAVTTILLRQQNRRRWHPRTLAYMFARFPRLQEIFYEPWRERDFGNEGTDPGEIIAHPFWRSYAYALKLILYIQLTDKLHP